MNLVAELDALKVWLDREATTRETVGGLLQYFGNASPAEETHEIVIIRVVEAARALVAKADSFEIAPR